MDIDTELYGGECPLCACPMFQKGCHGISSWFRYDVCPWCGYANSLYGLSSPSPEALFALLIDRYKVRDIVGLRAFARGLDAYKEFYPTSVPVPEDVWNHLCPVPPVLPEEQESERDKLLNAEEIHDGFFDLFSDSDDLEEEPWDEDKPLF